MASLFYKYICVFLHYLLDDCTGASCRRSIRNLKPPPHSTKLRGKNLREVIIKCDKGYLTANGKPRAVLKCIKGIIKGNLPVCKSNSKYNFMMF